MAGVVRWKIWSWPEDLRKVTGAFTPEPCAYAQAKRSVRGRNIEGLCYCEGM